MRIPILASILVAAAAAVRPAPREVVFDSITGATQAGGGITLESGRQGGEIVDLTGTSREITRIDVMLYEFGGGVIGDMTYRVNFWVP